MAENGDVLARRVPSFGRGLRILLVDPETSSLWYIASMLEAHSFRDANGRRIERLLYWTPNPHAQIDFTMAFTTMELASLAMAIFSQRRDEFDLVMADVNMQDMTNVGFIQQILLIRNHMPIIMMFRPAGMVLAGQALRNGACFCLEKPISDNELREVWQHVFRMRRVSGMILRGSSLGSIDTESQLLGVTIKEEVASSFSYTQFMEVDSLSRTATENDLDGTSQESWIDDLNNKIKQVKWDGDLEGDAQSTRRELLMMEADQKQGTGDRKRSNEDDPGKERCKRQLIHSQGGSPIEEVGNEKKQGSCSLEKGLYLRWTPDIHFKFTEAIRTLGEQKASPKAILELIMMKVPGLTLAHISSHLQKYKAHTQNMGEVDGKSPLPLTSSVNISTSSGNSYEGASQFQEEKGSVQGDAGASGADAGNFDGADK